MLLRSMLEDKPKESCSVEIHGVKVNHMENGQTVIKYGIMFHNNKSKGWGINKILQMVYSF